MLWVTSDKMGSCGIGSLASSHDHVSREHGMGIPGEEGVGHVHGAANRGESGEGVACVYCFNIGANGWLLGCRSW